MNTERNASFSFPLVRIIQVIFIIAKVFAVGPLASWSWFWIFCPLWITGLITIIFVVAIFLIAVVVRYVDKRTRIKLRERQRTGGFYH